MVLQPIDVEPRSGYRIWIRYSDGVTGEIDLSSLAGSRAFQLWDNPGFFKKVHIASHRAISWGNDIELCPDALYLKLTGKPVEEIMQGAKFLAGNA